MLYNCVKWEQKAMKIIDEARLLLEVKKAKVEVSV